MDKPEPDQLSIAVGDTLRATDSVDNALVDVRDLSTEKLEALGSLAVHFGVLEETVTVALRSILGISKAEVDIVLKGSSFSACRDKLEKVIKHELEAYPELANESTKHC